MRRTTGATLVEQARLFFHLLTHSPDAAIAHHADELRSFLAFLHAHAEVTHSVSALLPVREFPHPDDLIPGPERDRWQERVIRERKVLVRLLADLTERRAKLALRISPERR